jgi:hypothetical protein
MPLACEDCNKVLNRWQVSRKARWCSDCNEWYCQKCHERLDRPRGGRRCTDCNRQMRQERAARSDHCCCACKKPIARGVTRVYCPDCDRADYLAKMERLKAGKPRPCQSCGELMPIGRRPNQCRLCRQQHLKSRPSRPCAQCGSRLAVKGKSYCQPCQSMYARWLKDYHAGSTEARLMKPKKEYRKWQNS